MKINNAILGRAPGRRGRTDTNVFDARRPTGGAYLRRPDGQIDASFIAEARRLESLGLIRPQIAERLGRNLRDVFRALEGDEYFERWEAGASVVRRSALIADYIRRARPTAERAAEVFRVGRDEVWHAAETEQAADILRSVENPAGRPMKRYEETALKICYELKRTGAPQHEIAERFGVSKQTITNILHRYKIQRPRAVGSYRGRRGRELVAKVLALSAAGTRQRDIARLLGVCRGTIYRIEKLHGYKRPRGVGRAIPPKKREV